MGFDFVNTRLIGESGSQQYNTQLGNTTFAGSVVINGSSSISITYVTSSLNKLYFNNGLLVSASA